MEVDCVEASECAAGALEWFLETACGGACLVSELASHEEAISDGVDENGFVFVQVRARLETAGQSCVFCVVVGLVVAQVVVIPPDDVPLGVGRGLMEDHASRAAVAWVSAGAAVVVEPDAIWLGLGSCSRRVDVVNELLDANSESLCVGRGACGGRDAAELFACRVPRFQCDSLGSLVGDRVEGSLILAVLGSATRRMERQQQ